MFSSQVLRKNIFPSHSVNRRVRCLQSLRNSRPDLFQSSFSRNFTNVKDAEAGHKAEAVIPEGSKDAESGHKAEEVIPEVSKIPEKKATSLGELQVMGIGILTDFLVAFVLDKVSEYRVSSALENGTRPVPRVMMDEFVRRDQISKDLVKVFQPDKRHSYYHVVCGEHGTGKTTLTQMEAKNVGKGVIYVDIPSNFNYLGQSFGNAINMLFFEDTSITAFLVRKFLSSAMGLTGGESAISFYQWGRAMEIFRRASEVYKEKHGKPPVIIYDNVSQLIPENSKILDMLQDMAKRSADYRTYIAVFVSSEGSVPRRMELRSAWSRAKKPVIEIGDLNKEESMEYLTKKRKINEVEAKKLYELVGGRIVELKSVADDFVAGQSFEVIRQSILDETEKKFQSAQLLPGDQYYEIGKNIICALLSSKEKELRFLEFKKFFNN
ncbi:6276_t:CDS:2, partial [Ambispora gerdemannii]